MADYDPQAGQEATPLGYDPRRPAGGQRGESATDPALSWLLSNAPWNRPAYPSGMPPASGAAPQGQPAGKFQDRFGASPGPVLPTFEHGKSDPLQPTAQSFMGLQPQFGAQAAPSQGFMGSPGHEGLRQSPSRQFTGGQPQVAPSQGAPQGGGQPSGGGGPSGPVTLQSVMQSLAQSNPDMMKTKEGRIAIGMAALKFEPLMHKDDQMELARMKQELAFHTGMSKMELGEAKLDLAREKMERSSDRYQDPELKRTQAEYDNALKDRSTLANHLAQNKGDAKLTSLYNDANSRVDTLHDKLYPPTNDTKFSKFIDKTLTDSKAHGFDPVIAIMGELPSDVVGALDDADKKALAEMLIAEPIKAYMRVEALRRKLAGGGARSSNGTTVGKQGDGYYR